MPNRKPFSDEVIGRGSCWRIPQDPNTEFEIKYTFLAKENYSETIIGRKRDSNSPADVEILSQIGSRVPPSFWGVTDASWKERAHATFTHQKSARPSHQDSSDYIIIWHMNLEKVFLKW